MHSNENHSKTRTASPKPRRSEAQQARRDKVKAWTRTDKRNAWA